MKNKAIKWLNAQITDEMSKGDYDIVQYLKGLVNAEKKAKAETADESEWRPMFEKLWSIYPRKVAKAQAVKTFAKKVKGKSTDELKDFCNKVWRLIFGNARRLAKRILANAMSGTEKNGRLKKEKT